MMLLSSGLKFGPARAPRRLLEQQYEEYPRRQPQQELDRQPQQQRLVPSLPYAAGQNPGFHGARERANQHPGPAGNGSKRPVSLAARRHRAPHRYFLRGLAL